MTEIWSHRGYVDGPGSIAENTMAAFAAASSCGVQGIELDVWRTADGAWAVHHDRGVATGNLDELRWEDVPPDVPSLSEALASCRVDVVNVELKVAEEACGAQGRALGAALAAELVGQQGAGGSRVVVSSFCREAVEEVLALGTGLPVGLLVGGALPDGLVGELARAGYWALHAHHSVLDQETVARAHEAGLRAVAWTVDDPEEMHRLVAAGTDVLISNLPRLGLQAASGHV